MRLANTLNHLQLFEDTSDLYVSSHEVARECRPSFPLECGVTNRPIACRRTKETICAWVASDPPITTRSPSGLGPLRADVSALLFFMTSFGADMM